MTGGRTQSDFTGERFKTLKMTENASSPIVGIAGVVFIAATSEDIDVATIEGIFLEIFRLAETVLLAAKSIKVIV